MRIINKRKFWITYTILLVVYFIIVFTFGCTPQQRITSLVKKHPELVKNDTVTVIHQTTRKDTVVSIHSRDTVVIHKNNLTERIYIHNDTVYTEAECKGDTVKVEVDKIVTQNPTYHEIAKEFSWPVTTLCALIIIVLILKWK